MTTTDVTTDVTTIEAIGHQEAMRLQATEFDRAIALLRSLDAEDWTARTVCPDWDVRQMWLHVLGASEAGASVRENVHQMRAARRRRKDLGVPPTTVHARVDRPGRWPVLRQRGQ